MKLKLKLISVMILVTMLTNVIVPIAFAIEYPQENIQEETTKKENDEEEITSDPEITQEQPEQNSQTMAPTSTLEPTSKEEQNTSSTPKPTSKEAQSTSSTPKSTSKETQSTSSTIKTTPEATSSAPTQEETQKNEIKTIAETNVQFEDEALKQYLVETYDNDNDGELSQQEMLQITYLYIYTSDNNITNLKGLKYATNLRELGIYVDYEDNMEDISDVYELKNLEYLNISTLEKEKIDLEKISKLTNLQYLNLYYKNAGSDVVIPIAPLTKLTKLSSLGLHDAKFDISGIENMQNIEYLNLSISATYNDKNAVDFDRISKLKNLASLTLSGIYSIEGIEKITWLKDLYINPNGRVDFTPIKNLTNLTSLHLYPYVYFRDDGIDMNIFANLTKLEYLDISGKLLNYQVVSNFRNLEILTLTDAGIDSVEFLSDLTNLTTLTLDNNSITDITPLKNLNNLTSVSLNKNIISDISALKNLNSLQSVSLRQNNINPNEEKNAQTIQALQERDVQLDMDEYDGSEIIQFKDPKFKDYLIDNDYDLNNDQQISVNEIEKITFLDLNFDWDEYKDITSIEDIKYAKNIQELFINANNIDIMPIKNLTKLQTLRIMGKFENTQNFEILNGLNQLNELSIELYDGVVLNLSGIGKAKNLTKLMIGGATKIDNLGEIANLTKIKEFEIIYGGYDGIDVSEIAKSKTIETLNLSAAENIINAQSLGQMKQLKILEIPTSVDVQNIKGLINLKELCLKGNISQIKNIRETNNLKNLEKITLNSYEFDKYSFDRNTDEQKRLVDELQEVTCDNIEITGRFVYNMGILVIDEENEIKIEDVSPIVNAFMDQNNKLYNPNVSLQGYMTDNVSIDQQKRTIKVTPKSIGCQNDITIHVDSDNSIFSLDLTCIALKKEDALVDFNKIFDEIPALYDVDFKESEYLKVLPLIQKELDKIFEKYGINKDQLKEHNIEFGVYVPLVFDKESFYEGFKVYFVYRYKVISDYTQDEYDTTGTMSKNIKINYSNSNEYNEEDAEYVKNLQIDSPKYYEISWEEQSTWGNSSEKFYKMMSDYYTNLVNDDTITIKVYTGAGGSDGGLNLWTWEGGTNIAIFKNGKLYDTRTLGNECVIPVFTIPSSLPEEEIKDYLVNKIKETYPDDPYYNEFCESITEVTKGATIKNDSVSNPWTEEIKDGYTVKSSGEDCYIIIKRANKGDVDGDGEITLQDYAKILSNVKGITTLDDTQIAAADVDGDGEITLQDYAKVLSYVKGIGSLER